MTDADFIGLTGTRAMARIIGIDPSRVAHWKRLGIPHYMRAKVLDASQHPHPDPEAYMRGQGRPA